MSEKIKNEVVEEVTETVEVKETKEGFMSKAKGWVKRNGKKVALGAVGVVGLGLAYALGQKSAEVSEDFMDEEEADSDTDEIEFTEIESE